MSIRIFSWFLVKYSGQKNNWFVRFVSLTNQVIVFLFKKYLAETMKIFELVFLLLLTKLSDGREFRQFKMCLKMIINLTFFGDQAMASYEVVSYAQGKLYIE